MHGPDISGTDATGTVVDNWLLWIDAMFPKQSNQLLPIDRPPLFPPVKIAPTDPNSPWDRSSQPFEKKPGIYQLKIFLLHQFGSFDVEFRVFANRIVNRRPTRRLLACQFPVLAAPRLYSSVEQIDLSNMSYRPKQPADPAFPAPAAVGIPIDQHRAVLMDSQPTEQLRDLSIGQFTIGDTLFVRFRVLLPIERQSPKDMPFSLCFDRSGINDDQVTGHLTQLLDRKQIH